MKHFILFTFVLFISPLFSTITPPLTPKLCEGSELCVVQFNAAFNTANEVTWLNELTDCSQSTVDIMADPSIPAEYKIVVVPTLVIFNGGEEVKRFQANIMMTMETTKKEVQDAIDEIIMEAF